MVKLLINYSLPECFILIQFLHNYLTLETKAYFWLSVPLYTSYHPFFRIPCKSERHLKMTAGQEGVIHSLAGIEDTHLSH